MPAKKSTPEEKTEKAKFEPVRWTLERAASEFNINPRTLSKRMKVEAILPGEDGKFSTLEICRARFGDYEIQRTRKMKEDADTSALANAKVRGQLIDLPDFQRHFEGTLSSMRQIIMGSELSDGDKDRLLSDLAKLFTVPERSNEDESPAVSERE